MYSIRAEWPFVRPRNAAMVHIFSYLFCLKTTLSHYISSVAIQSSTEKKQCLQFFKLTKDLPYSL